MCPSSKVDVLSKIQALLNGHDASLLVGFSVNQIWE
jgi:hypothetical protein